MKLPLIPMTSNALHITRFSNHTQTAMAMANDVGLCITKNSLKLAAHTHDPVVHIRIYINKMCLVCIERTGGWDGQINCICSDDESVSNGRIEVHTPFSMEYILFSFKMFRRIFNLSFSLLAPIKTSDKNQQQMRP